MACARDTDSLMCCLVEWAALDALIPRERVPEGDDPEQQSFALGPNDESFSIVARSPGSRWADTDPPGGDFDIALRWPAAAVDGAVGFREFFNLLGRWLTSADSDSKLQFVRAIAAVSLEGSDPVPLASMFEAQEGLSPLPLLLLGQGLALAEHRRFGDTESDGGGRQLPGDLALGMVLGRWGPEDAASAAALGHVGLRDLQQRSQVRGILPPLPAYIAAMEKSGKLPPLPPLRGPEEPHEQESRLRARALELLRQIAGADADFRPQQWETIRDLVFEKKSILLVQRTGWGKTAVYFIATQLRREQGAAPAIVISPLLSLMRNQIEMSERAGISAGAINSANRDQHAETYKAIGGSELDLLLVTPEWVAKQEFKSGMMDHLRDASLLVIDEAHCISDWGHDFRPDYRRLVELFDELEEHVPVLGTTATANKRVILDVVAQFGDRFEVVRGPLARPGLRFSVFQGHAKAARLAGLLDVIRTSNGVGIVYCLTIAETVRVAKWLKEQGIDAVEYHGSLDDEDRVDVERALMESNVQVVVATSALGMGFDKPDIEFVVHLQSPISVVEYYQQAGRAGRGIPSARAILMSGPEDALIHDHFLETAFITEQEARQIRAAIPDDGAWTQRLEQNLNMSRERLEKGLKLLHVEGAITLSHNNQWFRTNENWTYDEGRPRRVRGQRQLERSALRRYAAAPGCRMRFLMEELDDPDPQDCGECDFCVGEVLELAAGTDLSAIEEQLGEIPIWIRPKERAPATRRNRRTYHIHRHAWGRALSVFGEGQLGEAVEAARSGGVGLGREVLEGAVELIGGWNMNPSPTWVTAVPSSTMRSSLEAFAKQLAERLGLAFRESLYPTRQHQPQVEMMNDAQAYENLGFAFEATINLPTDPVLLVDDFVNSGWTFAITAMTLRKEADIEAVVPFALAKIIR